jgi:hypothetical protein
VNDHLLLLRYLYSDRWGRSSPRSHLRLLTVWVAFTWSSTKKPLAHGSKWQNDEWGKESSKIWHRNYIIHDSAINIVRDDSPLAQAKTVLLQVCWCVVLIANQSISTAADLKPKTQNPTVYVWSKIFYHIEILGLGGSRRHQRQTIPKIVTYKVVPLEMILYAPVTSVVIRR